MRVCTCVYVDFAVTQNGEGKFRSRSQLLSHSLSLSLSLQCSVSAFGLQEFLRRHGSTSKLCRKVRSADNLPLASTNRQQSDQRSSKEDGIDGDKESFLRSTQEEKCEDTESKRQSSLESCPKDNPDISLLDPNHQQSQQSSR